MEKKWERTVGSSGLSIGTHLMLESLEQFEYDKYDESRELPQDPITADDYDHHLFNLFTLVRNLLNSCSEKNKITIITSREFKSMVDDEINLLQSIYSKLDLELILYCPDYSKPMKMYNVNKPFSVTKAYSDFYATQRALESFKMIQKGYLLPTVEKRVLCTTHIATDLFSNRDKMDLFESHTGRIKKPDLFYTKYHSVGEDDMSKLPFNEYLMYILGDNLFVSPGPLLLRKELLDISTSKRWTPNTTLEKIKFDIKNSMRLKSYIAKFRPLHHEIGE